MKILIANRCLGYYSGTEIVTRDLALAFQALGHRPMVYAPRVAATADDLRAAGIAVYDNALAIAEAPDVIHANHPKELIESLLRFPGVPAICVCHDATATADEPVYHPRVHRYVAVDERCRQRIERHPRIPADRIGVELNAVDLLRFVPRPPLPARPARALVFSNYASRATHVPAVRRACRRASIRLDVVGKGVGRQVAEPERVLGSYDVIFAKARCAIEAMAVGSAVVLCDFAGLGPLVTSANFDELRPRNFGRAALTAPLTAKGVLGTLARYDATDAAQVSKRVREEAGLDQAARRWVARYEAAIREASGCPPQHEAEQLAILEYLRQWSYDARMQWEREQIERLGTIPLVGPRLVELTNQMLEVWGMRRKRAQP